MLPSKDGSIEKKGLLEISRILKEKELELQKTKIESEVYYKKIEDLSLELAQMEQTRKKISVDTEITDLCKVVAEIVPKYQKRLISYLDVAEFIDQFDDSEIKLNLLKQLRRIKYIDQEQMQQGILKQLNQVAPKSSDKVVLCLFKKSIPESDTIWTYLTNFYVDEGYQVINVRALKENIEERDPNDELYYIFIDDVIGSGNQFINNFKNQLGISLENFERIKKNYKKIHLKIIAGVGSWESKSNISKELKVFTDSDIQFDTVIHEEDKAFNPKHWNKTILLKTKKFLSQKDPDYWQGYKNCEFLVVLEWNVPNNTIGCLWNDANGWKPLFPRR